ncbi:MAG: glycoside hydrolase family 78 protein, partial [Roseburia sp.]|nr:glycoside hydrolase family 78 protein [Roseburia sp.]
EEGQEAVLELPEDGKSFVVQLAVKGEILQVTINEKEAGSFQIEKTPIGSVGYYKSRGVSYAWLDELLAEDAQGNIIYKEDFEGENTIFDPYYVSAEDGRLKIGSGLMLTPGAVFPAPLFRKEFAVQDKEIDSARIYMTALGSFALSLNGERVSEDYFSPGKLAYNKQLSYVTYDVTGFLKQGDVNALGAVLLHGWYDRGVGYPEIWNPWGEKNALLGKLEIVYADGSMDRIVTDNSFLCCVDGPVREDDMYQGEFYDANYEQAGYDKAGYEGSTWKAAEENQVKKEYLTIPMYGKANEPIVCAETLMPVSVSEPVPNTYVYDFGQNFAGICRIKVTGQKGQVVTLRYGEELNREELINKDDALGTIWTENLFTAEATDYYVLKGEEQGEIFEPEFVFHGFRYVQITGIEEALPIADVQGIVLSSDLERTGYFSCSNELLNQYYQNTLWSQKSNFLDNPMDCPQRDERHGWAGDAQIFSLTASYNMNVFAFYRKFLQEERAIQSEGGSFADMIPRNFSTNWDGTGGAVSNNCWGDAPVVIAWNLYMQYGDASILKENFESLCRWVDMLEYTSEDYIRYGGGYGDHLSNEDTPKELSDTAWCAHSADLVSRMADVLGREEEAEHYRQVFEKYKQAWQRQFVLPDGWTSCNTQTSYALGLEFDLFPEELAEKAAATLELLAQYSNYHINTGFSGIGYLLPAYSDYGYAGTAYRMLLQEEIPSVLFPAVKGATTNWEQLWAYRQQEEGYRLDGSLNHYAYGAPVSWLYTDVLGIKSDEAFPGYKHILLEPKAGGGLLFAEGSYSGAYGEISVKWEQEENGYHYYFTIPANATATLTLPAVSSGGYLESGKEAEQAAGVTLLQNDGETVQYELLSGKYEFTQK